MKEGLVYTPKGAKDGFITSFVDLQRRIQAGEQLTTQEAIEQIKRSIAEGRPATQEDVDYAQEILKQGG